MIWEPRKNLENDWNCTVKQMSPELNVDGGWSNEDVKEGKQVKIQ